MNFSSSYLLWFFSKFLPVIHCNLTTLPSCSMHMWTILYRMKHVRAHTSTPQQDRAVPIESYFSTHCRSKPRAQALKKWKTGRHVPWEAWWQNQLSMRSNSAPKSGILNSYKLVTYIWLIKLKNYCILLMSIVHTADSKQYQIYAVICVVAASLVWPFIS